MTRTIDSHFKRDVIRYVIGLTGAGVLTLLSYVAVTQQWFADGMQTAVFILFVAGVQLVVQLYFFLHLDDDGKPRWRTYSFLFTGLMLLVVVVGSLWIMQHMNYRMHLTGEQMEQYMIEQVHEGF